MKLPVILRRLLPVLVLGVAGPAGAADLPPPFEGRIDAVSVASRQVTIGGVTYRLTGSARVQGEDGRLVPLRATDAGRPARVQLAAPVPGAAGHAPIVSLTLINE
ncbi:MAG: hypothetical protein JNM50_05160 [Chromatiales bacterium]|jgi:hypothetical protein|nr:hypothetical protein [Chromatiales bacterium]